MRRSENDDTPVGINFFNESSWQALLLWSDYEVRVTCLYHGNFFPLGTWVNHSNNGTNNNFIRFRNKFLIFYFVYYWFSCMLSEISGQTVWLSLFFSVFRLAPAKFSKFV